MRIKDLLKLLTMLILIFLFTTCTTFSPLSTPTTHPTPTPIPLSEIDLEPILIRPGDLPAGYSGAQIQDSPSPPGMFKDIKGYQKSISQQLEKNGKAAGLVTIFLFDSISQRNTAYYRIVDGFGESQDDSGIKMTVAALSDVGERAVYALIDASSLDAELSVGDLAFVRCNAFVHIRFARFDNANVSSLSAYAKRLDKRLIELICH